MKIYVKVFKNKYGKKQACLVFDLEYKELVISWDTNLCAEVLGVATRELMNYEVDNEPKKLYIEK